MCMVHSYSGILPSNKKEQTIDTCKSTHEPTGKYSERNQSERVTYCVIPIYRSDKIIVMEKIRCQAPVLEEGKTIKE